MTVAAPSLRRSNFPENTEKVTNPGNKTVYRIYSKSTGKIKADLICLADEVFDPEETMIIFDPTDTWKKD